MTCPAVSTEKRHQFSYKKSPNNPIAIAFPIRTKCQIYVYRIWICGATMLPTRCMSNRSDTKAVCNLDISHRNIDP